MKEDNFLSEETCRNPFLGCWSGFSESSGTSALLLEHHLLIYRYVKNLVDYILQALAGNSL